MSITQHLAREIGQDVTEQKAFTLTSPEAYGLFAGLQVRSGVTVTSATALRVPAVAAAVGLISEACGNLPFKLHDRDTREAQKDHPAYELIHGEANPWTSAEELREHLTRDALLTGHGFAQVVRNGEGKPLELHWIDFASADVSVETPMNDTTQSPLEMLAALEIALALVNAGILTAAELRAMIGLPANDAA
ncbi:phage portal protein [Paracoccus aminovorans]|nr:phage portal protein [Paracoccus aminovorans]